MLVESSCPVATPARHPSGHSACRVQSEAGRAKTVAGKGRGTLQAFQMIVDIPFFFDINLNWMNSSFLKVSCDVKLGILAANSSSSVLCTVLYPFMIL